MLSSLLLVASQVGTLFLMMAVGFCLAKKDKLTVETVSQITFLLLNIVVPCVIIEALQTPLDSSLLQELGYGTLFVVGTYVAYCLIIIPFFRGKAEGTRVCLQFGAIYGNVGFMGLPLVQAVLGDGAMVYASLAFVVFTFVNWSHGIMMMGGRKQASLRTLFLNTGVIACIVGLGLFLGEITLPTMVGDAVSFVAGMNTPLAMVVIGAQMAWADLSTTFRTPMLYQGAAIKLVFLPLFTALVLLPLPLSPLLYCTIVILSATPTAGITAMFAVRFGRDADTAAQMISLTTLLSILTLPIFGALANFLAY